MEAAFMNAPQTDTSASQRKTVLIIDDEFLIRMLMSEVLNELGYNVLEADNGPSGLDILQSNQQVDLLISDIGLPSGLSGRQVADAARIFRPELRVLFITGYGENAALGNGTLQIRTDVMTKPFALDVLAAKIRTMMA
jgi:CheY-like chemotaxis protein